MSEYTELSKDHPTMVAWEKFKESEEFCNALDWALRTKYSDGREIDDKQRREHVLGSLWRMFLEGLNVGSARITELEAQLADYEQKFERQGQRYWALKRHADAMAEADSWERLSSAVAAYREEFPK